MPRIVTPLKLAIVASGLTQREVAQAVGEILGRPMSDQRLSQHVYGRHADEATREALAHVLGRTQADLFPELREQAA